jgi:hypothetical protein
MKQNKITSDRTYIFLAFSKTSDALDPPDTKPYIATTRYRPPPPPPSKTHSVRRSIRSCARWILYPVLAAIQVSRDTITAQKVLIRMLARS